MLAKIAGPPAAVTAKGALERDCKQVLSYTPTKSLARKKSPRVEKTWGGLPTVNPTDSRISTYDGTNRGLARLLGNFLPSMNADPPATSSQKRAPPNIT